MASESHSDPTLPAVETGELTQRLRTFAVQPCNTRGRRYAEAAPRHRSEFQRDRDRIIHCSAFRRLEYKTQVFVNHEGDMFRTRLTHSLEVSQVARTIARALGVNEDLTEAIALAHDLGHTPFGHAGQDALNDCMRRFGGFEHNHQSLRVVDQLESRYADFPGLNLLFETREGILKHCSRKRALELGDVGERFINGTRPTVEAQIANLADEIAYNHHDIDDGIRAGLLDHETLNASDLFQQTCRRVQAAHQNADRQVALHIVIREMLSFFVNDLIETALERAGDFEAHSLDDVRSADALVHFSPHAADEHQFLKTLLRRELYFHEAVLRNAEQAKAVVGDLFDRFVHDPSLLPDGASTCEDEQTFMQRVADYIAGMTDRYAYATHQEVNKKIPRAAVRSDPP